MKLPTRFAILRSEIANEVSYGFGGIRLFADAELEMAQAGYSVTPNGKSLSDGKEGSWHRDWLVIGYETACGDPVFIDTGAPSLPVMTAMHGQGTWEANPVASSVEAFARCLDEFARVATHRRNPVELSEHPLSDEERREFLQRVAAINDGMKSEFWAVLVEG